MTGQFDKLNLQSCEVAGPGGGEVGVSSVEGFSYVASLLRQFLEKQLGNGGDN